MEKISYSTIVSEIPENGLGAQTGETDATLADSERKDFFFFFLKFIGKI
jgi:hypothetical protein